MSMEATDKTTNQDKKRKHFSFLYVLGGGFLKEDFFTRHTRMIVLVVILIFFFFLTVWNRQPFFIEFFHPHVRKIWLPWYCNLGKYHRMYF